MTELLVVLDVLKWSARKIIEIVYFISDFLLLLKHDLLYAYSVMVDCTIYPSKILHIRFFDLFPRLSTNLIFYINTEQASALKSALARGRYFTSKALA